MNKYFLLITVLAVAVAGGILLFSLNSNRQSVSSPHEAIPFQNTQSSMATSSQANPVREVTITVKAGTWAFTPDVIEVNRGDEVMVTVLNEDNREHGIAIDAFNISRLLRAKGTVKFDFVATQAGEFPFYCNIPCGEGEVNGVTRGHFDMTGTIRVKELVKTE